MKYLKAFFTLFFILGIGLTALFLVFGVTVQPATMGVRQINFGPHQGISREGLSPGYHWTLPFYSEIRFIPENLQFLDFHSESGTEHLVGDLFPPFEVQTADRATVDVEATVLYRFYSRPSPEGVKGREAHGGPADLLSSVGTTRQLWVNKVRRAADDALKRALGELATGEFYLPDARERQVQVALDIMNFGSKDYELQGLRSQGIHVEAILLRRYIYREERIENAIFQKNLQDQEEALNVAQGELAKAQALSAEEEARGEARNRTLLIKGEQDVTVIRSQAELEETRRKAEADLLVARARAESDRLKAAALAQGLGADIVVAREMGPLLQSLKGGVVTNVDPYDLDAWMKRLGLSAGRKAQ